MQLFDDLEDFGSFDDAVAGDVRDPYTELARMRRKEPVQRLDMSGMPHEESKPVFMVYRYDEIAQVLRDHETFSSGIIINVFGDVFGKHVMLGMDEPEHRRYRSLVSKAFTQKALARRQDELVERVANELIDRFAERGRAELVREFTFPYPTQIIAGLLGLPRADYPQFQRWSISLLSFTVNRERGIAASKALKEYFAPILAAPATGAARRPHQHARAGRDRRRVPLGRGDLLLLAPAAPSRCRDHVPLDREPAVRVALQPRAARRRPLRSVAHPAGHRGGGSVGGAAAHHHARGHPRHRARRCADSGWLRGHAHARCGQPGRGSVPGSRPLRHLPRAEAPHLVRPRRPRLPRDAPDPARDARRARTSCSTGCRTCASIPRARIRTSAGRYSGRRRRCRCCSMNVLELDFFTEPGFSRIRFPTTPHCGSAGRLARAAQGRLHALRHRGDPRGLRGSRTLLGDRRDRSVRW